MNVLRTTIMILLAAASNGPAGAAPLAWWLERTATIDRLGDLDGAIAVAVAEDGAAVAAFPSDDKRACSLVLSDPDADGTTTATLPGDVRALRFADDGRTVLAIVARRFKRRPPETHLFAVDRATLKSRRLVHLPHDAWDVTEPPGSGRLVVASTDELRTFRWPDLASGPLYRLTGENRSVLALGDDRFLVANGSRLVLLDLTDPPGEDGMPIRGSTDASDRILELGRTDEPGKVAARLAGDRPSVLLEVPRNRRPAAALPTPARPDSVGGATGSTRDVPQAPAVIAEIRSDVGPAADDDEAATTPGAPGDRPGHEETQSDSPTAASSTDDAPTTTDRDATVRPSSPDASDVPDPPAACRIRGRVTGTLSNAVRHVVAYGPDSPFLEATRVEPGPDGWYCFDDLAPGSYRLVPIGGIDRVVEADPPFRVVASDAEPTTAPPFEILRVR